MNLRPTRDNLLIRRAKPADTSSGGIILPDSAKDAPHRGTVVAAGSGYHTESGAFVATECKEGDVVLFGAGLGVEVDVNGETLIILGEPGILAVLEVA